jgi:hypothetical protein
MDSWLKGLIAAASVVVIAGGAYYGWNEYRQSQALRASSQTREDNQKLEALTNDRCFGVVNTLVTQHKASPITDASQVPPDMAHDIGLCIRRVPMGDFTKNELERTGLISVFRNS